MVQGRPLGDYALTFQIPPRDGTAADLCPEESDRRIATVMEWVGRLRNTPLADRIRILPGIASVSVEFDPLELPSAALQEFLERLLDEQAIPALSRKPPLEIPVRFGGPDGPDLDEASVRLRLTPNQVVERIEETQFRVAMIGFMPGFPYLVGTPSELWLPRRATPRTRVPAGSVAIGNEYTGIYPRSSPGGWHLIGRTDIELFDPDRPCPSLLHPGDCVRFVAV